MTAKQIIFGDEVRQALLKGVDILAKAVVTTMGPKGRNVGIDKKWGAPSILHDGVSVAKEIDLEEPFANMGAQLVKEAASQTNDKVGDGTTTATLLAQAIVTRGIKNITAGANPMQIKKGLEKALDAVLAELKKMAKPIKDQEEFAQVATISASDEEIGKKIAEAMKKVGKNGVITVEEGRGLELDIKYTQGMEFDQGYVSAYFVTNPDRMEAEIEDPFILITDKKISSVQEIVPFLENAVKTTKNFVIIADDIEAEALATLVVNKMRGAFNVLAVKAPGFGDRRQDMLADIAILTGGTVISEDAGRELKSVTLEDCGRAARVIADKDSCQIIGGVGRADLIASRVAQIKKEIDRCTSDYDKEKLQERLAKLAGGVAVIEVGAATEVELKERQERVKDAVGATQAAAAEGVLPGGGVALLKAAKVLDNLKMENQDQQVGVDIMRYALEQPLRQIASNCDEDAGAILRQVQAALKERPQTDIGYNALTGELESMAKAGILDPAKVTRSALENATSIGAMILTTDVLVTEIPEKEEKQTAPMSGGMGY